MPVYRDKPWKWDEEIKKSVAMYNAWFVGTAPGLVDACLHRAHGTVIAAFNATNHLSNISAGALLSAPDILPALRMSTCPTLAVDRLVGFSGVDKNIVACLEDGRLPAKLDHAQLLPELQRVVDVINQLLDKKLFPWLARRGPPLHSSLNKALAVVTDRLGSSWANPAIRNAQEQRQLYVLSKWLTDRGGYLPRDPKKTRFDELEPGTFAFRMDVPVRKAGAVKATKLPIDAVIMPKRARPGDFPLLFEAKSSGDFTNPNKRRKEEAQKMNQLRTTYGDGINLNLLLCGYFDVGYLDYEADEGIDWLWEHNLNDLAEFGL